MSSNPPCPFMCYLCSIWISSLSLSILPICAPPQYRHCLSLLFLCSILPVCLCSYCDQHWYSSYLSLFFLFLTDILPACLCSSCGLNWYPSYLSLFFLCSKLISFLYVSVLFVIYAESFLPACPCSSCVLHWYPSCMSLCFTPVLHACFPSVH